MGYFLYYYLYAGNWDYYFSGIWSQEAYQLSTLFNPGFYLFGKSIPIPKILAVPLTLGLFSIGGYLLGKYVEEICKKHLLFTDNNSNITRQTIQHRIFTLCTFISFNFFFTFAGRPLISLSPLSWQFFFEWTIVTLSTLWLARTWGEKSHRYFP